MKKALLKVFGVAALAAGMMYNVQVSDTGNSSNLSLSALENTAVAQSESFQGTWYVAGHSPTSWSCWNGGLQCCYGFDC